MPNVETPDGKVVEFPDTMSASEINSVLSKQYSPVQEQPKTGKSFGGFFSNIGSNTKDIAKGLLNLVAHPVKSAQGITDVGLGIVDPYINMFLPKITDPEQIALEKRHAIAAAPLQDLINRNVSDPLGIPKRVLDFAYDKPVSTAMNVSLGLGGASQVAGVSGAEKLANALDTASTYTNPIQVAAKTALYPVNKLAISGVPESLYARALKIPPGSLNQQGRDKVVRTLLRDEKLPLGKNTVDSMNAMIGDLDNRISGVIDSASSGGANVNINKVTTALDNLKKEYASRPNPQQYYDTIDKVKDDFISHSFVNNGGQINLADAHALKKGTYQEIQDYYMKNQKPETGRVGIRNDVDATAKAEAAKTLRQEVLDNPMIPESVKADMAKEAGLLNARKWVERATNRGGNVDPLSLSGMLFGVMVEGGLPAATAFQIAKSQPVMSRLAIGMSKKRNVSKSSGQLPFQLQQIVPQNKEDLINQIIGF